jgi:hypothetical protein
LRSLIDNPDLRMLALQHVRRTYPGHQSFQNRNDESSAFIANERIIRTLSAAIGHDELTTAKDWWGWWNQYQQVFAGVKPVLQRDYEETWWVDRNRGVVETDQRYEEVWSIPTLRVTARPGGSCFAAGTPVMTEYGPKPIEEIQLGDRVLSQDVETGEIAFKPVLNTTVRPPVGLLKVTTKTAELLCTGGHPFWVNDHDWLYARELAPGMRFHSIMGGEEITAVEDAEREEQAYNLIVADFHTYFAGEARVLSHDNTPRNPTNALVPGLMPDWSVAAEDDVVADN